MGQDLSNMVFGELTVQHIDNDRLYHWVCRCSCGSIKSVRGTSLISKHTKSCGCLGRMTGYKHGMRKTPEYKTWQGLKDRCSNKNNPSYNSYGGRGIKVCDRWLHSFENFYTDLGSKPSKKYSIDRIDVNGDYSPENCKWATPKEQANNRRTNIYIDFNGLHLTIAEWARYLGIAVNVLHARIRRGDLPPNLFRKVNHTTKAIIRRGE